MSADGPAIPKLSFFESRLTNKVSNQPENAIPGVQDSNKKRNMLSFL